MPSNVLPKNGSVLEKRKSSKNRNVNKNLRGTLFPLRFIFGKTKAYLLTKKTNQSNLGKYPSARGEAYEKYGRKFMNEIFLKRIHGKKETFVVKEVPFTVESVNSIAILSVQKTKPWLSGKIGWVGLGFSPNAVIVEVIQGRRDTLAEQDRFRQHPSIHMHWPNYILGVVEERAKALGFKRVKIRAPESLYSYHFSAYGSMPGVRKEMNILYSTVAKAMGYKRRGMFYVKNL